MGRDLLAGPYGPNDKFMLLTWFSGCGGNGCTKCGLFFRIVVKNKIGCVNSCNKVSVSAETVCYKYE